MKLFAIYIGGEHPAANIEIHDMRFIVAPTIEETYPELIRQWWGKPSTLHVDCWAEIDRVDGYQVELRPEPFGGPEKLYFVNLGGYDGTTFAESHRNVFVIATSVKEAKARAIQVGKGWADLHRDDLYEAEQAFSLDDAVGPLRLHIHLTPGADPSQMAFTCAYKPLKAMKASS
jgi:hypothetical protein